MKYKLVKSRKNDIIKLAKQHKEFIARDIANDIKCDPSALSPFIAQLKKEGIIRIIGNTYIKNDSGRLQLRKVYRYIDR